MNKEELERALDFARMFGKEYNQVQADLEQTQKNIRIMKSHLDSINKCLRGKIDPS